MLRNLKRVLVSTIVLATIVSSLTALVGGCTAAPTTTFSPTPVSAAYTPLAPKARVRVATTTSLYDTGLWSYLEPMFEKKYGVELDVIYTGSGKALEYGMKGDVDVLTVHDKPNEEKFVADGYGAKRVPFAYNYFLIVGPADDPAGIKSMKPEDAFKTLMTSGRGDFVSRGDNSGTHSKEKAIWTAAGYKYDDVRKARAWYLEAGGGMGPTLQMAHEKKAYTLTDIGTYLAYKGKLELVPIVEKGSILLNVYSVIPINPDKVKGAKADMANNVVTFMTSDEIQKLIGEYGLKDYGISLFTPLMGKPEPTE